MATHSSTPVWRRPRTEEPGGLYGVHGVAKSQTRLSDFHFSVFFGPEAEALIGTVWGGAGQQ